MQRIGIQFRRFCEGFWDFRWDSAPPSFFGASTLLHMKSILGLAFSNQSGVLEASRCVHFEAGSNRRPGEAKFS